MTVIKNISLFDLRPTTRHYIEKEDGKDRVIITMGAGSYISTANISMWNSHILVGKYCSIANDIKFLVGGNHNYNAVTSYEIRSPEFLRYFNEEQIKEEENDDLPVHTPLPANISKLFKTHQVIIGNDVWIGAHSTIVNEVSIGNGAVIGTGAVVAKDVPPYAIVVGNPARVIKYRFSKDIIRKLQAIKWWNWSPEKIIKIPRIFSNVEKFVEKYYSPELEYPQQDELGDKLIKAKRQGKIIYSCIADFRVIEPMWKKIIKEYIQAFTKNDSLILIMWTGLNVMPEDMKELNEHIKSLNTENKSLSLLLIQSTPEKIFSPYALQQSHYFITTREDINTQCIDWLYNTNVKLVSSLDGYIFEN